MKPFRLSFLDLLLHVALALSTTLLVLFYAYSRYHQVTGSWLAAAVLTGIWVQVSFVALYLFKIAVDIERIMKMMEER